MKHFLVFFFIGVTFWYGLSHTGVVLSAEDLSDFEKIEYQDNTLNGKDGWSDVWNTLLVDDMVKYQGKKSIHNQMDFAGLAYKNLSSQFLEQGVLTTFLKIEDNTFSDNQQIVGIFKGVGEEYVAVFRFANNFEGYTNAVLLSRAGSAETIFVGGINQGQWHKLSLGWRTEDYFIRVRLDDGAWSDWVPSETVWSAEEPFGVRISLPSITDYGNFYLNSLFVHIGTEEEVPVQEEFVITETEVIPVESIIETKEIEVPAEVVLPTEQEPVLVEENQSASIIDVLLPEEEIPRGDVNIAENNETTIDLMPSISDSLEDKTEVVTTQF